MHSPDHVEDNNNAKYYIHIRFVDPIDPLYKNFIIPEDDISFSPRILPTRITFPLPLGHWLLFLRQTAILFFFCACRPFCQHQDEHEEEALPTWVSSIARS